MARELACFETRRRDCCVRPPHERRLALATLPLDNRLRPRARLVRRGPAIDPPGLGHSGRGPVPSHPRGSSLRRCCCGAISQGVTAFADCVPTSLADGDAGAYGTCVLLEATRICAFALLATLA